MHSKIKAFQLVIALLLLLNLCGCQNIEEMIGNYETFAKNEKYSVIVRDGQFFIRFHSTPPKSIFQVVFEDITPKFSSSREMRQTILTGDFSDDYYNQLRHIHGGKKEFSICDLSVQYEPSLPLGWRQEYVSWYQTRYYYKITDGVHSGSFTYFLKDESLYRRYLDDAIKFYSNNESVRIRSAGNKDATVYELPRDRTMVYYTLSTQDKQLSIMEIYIYPNTYLDESSRPDGISVYVAEKGHFYQFYINEPSRRPSVEWLQSFGLKDSAAE